MICRLEARAHARGMSLNELAVEILTRMAHAAEPGSLVDEIAAMRASQPVQDNATAAADVRALRDGAPPADSATRAA